MERPGYDRKLDGKRLDDQLHDILTVMLHAHETNSWLTLREIWQLTKHGESSISAQLRNLRKAPHRYIVEKRRRGEPGRGCWEYQVSKPILDADLFKDAGEALHITSEGQDNHGRA